MPQRGQASAIVEMDEIIVSPSPIKGEGGRQNSCCVLCTTSAITDATSDKPVKAFQPPNQARP